MSQITLQEAIERYGKIEGGKWADEGKWMIRVDIPEEISATWINSATGKPTTHIYAHKELEGPLQRALLNLVARGLLSELKTFDGCFMLRDVRGEPGHPSWHSYGLAIDVNAAENQLGCEPSLSPEFVACFNDEGFVWGGTFHRLDGMHFQLASG